MSEGAALEPGASGSATLVVAESDTAASLALETGDVFPAVLATARMIALMELAAGRAMRPSLAPGQLSVGVALNVEHTAPTPVGSRVTATARFTGRDGKFYLFEVSARDEAGEVGRGTHRRAVVATERLLAGAARRRAG